MATSPSTPFTAELFSSGRFADFVIECGGYCFKVHKFHLFTVSGYFRNLLSSDMKEVQDGKVIFEDIDPCLIARILVWCYDSQYPLCLDSSKLPVECHELLSRDKYNDVMTNSFSRVELAVDLYVVAERLQIEQLMEYLCLEFKNAFYCLDASGSTPRAMLDSDSTKALIKHVYSQDFSTNNGFTKEVLCALKRHFQMGHHLQAEYSHIKEIVYEIPELLGDIFEDYIDMLTVKDGKRENGILIYSISVQVPDMTGAMNMKVTDESEVQSILEYFNDRFRRNGRNAYVEFRGQNLDKSTRLKCLGLDGGETFKICKEAAAS